MKQNHKTKLAPISKDRARKLLKFTKEISKAYKNSSSYMDRDDIKIN
jgi:hypothetical protein